MPQRHKFGTTRQSDAMFVRETAGRRDPAEVLTSPDATLSGQRIHAELDAALVSYVRIVLVMLIKGGDGTDHTRAY